jgi:dTDP-4-dehydrorhamnose 3,5-epimerase
MTPLSPLSATLTKKLGHHPPPSEATLQKLETSLPGVLELRPTLHRDARGFFLETYHQAKYAQMGIPDTFVQDNHSVSRKGTLRGLHYQLYHPQAKLCRVVEGQALDVAVDVRRGSPTFGQWTSVLLTGELQNQIYIPAGFAHGFLALSESAQFLYKCSDFYNAGDERGILWSDPALAIAWKIDTPIVSDKDARLPTLGEVPPEFLPSYGPQAAVPDRSL